MEKRRFGRTGHMSTVAIFGAAAFWDVTQDEADAVMDKILTVGINHIDVAPSYGKAEIRIGPWMPHERKRFFLGCKTMERTRNGAWAEMERSLKRLQVDTFDLFQAHAVTTFDELDALTKAGGALDAMIKARDQGIIHHIGITGHGIDAPAIYLEALRRFDFDTILFPVSFILWANPDYRRNAEVLLAECKRLDVGTMIIKHIARGPWGDKTRTHTTWYEPFSQAEIIQQAVNFALSQPVTGLCTAGDIQILPLMLEACEKFTPLNDEEQAALIQRAIEFEPLFT